MLRVGTVCLSVKDIEKSVKFYCDIGFKPLNGFNEIETLFVTQSGMRLGIVSYSFYAEDIYGKNPPPADNKFSGVCLTHYAGSKDEVEQYAKLVKDAGGTILRGPTDLDWGGYLLYFADFDGNVWEVIYSSDFKVDDKGMRI